MATRNYRRTAYLEGTAAKQLERGFEAEKLPVRKKVSNTTRKNREKMFHMNLGYVAFLVIALALATFTLCGYIELQSGITNHVKQISEMEAEYNSLKMANDEEYNRSDHECLRRAKSTGSTGIKQDREQPLFKVGSSRPFSAYDG